MLDDDKASNSAWTQAESYGCDMSNIEANLKLTPIQRIKQHDRAINQAMTLRQAAIKQIHGLSEAIASTTES